MQEIDLPALGQRIARGVREHLRRRLAEHGGGETLLDPADLKSAHDIDRRAGVIAREALAGHRCNIHIEGESAADDPAAEFCVYIDPVDGSLNWDRGIGDPAFVLAAGIGPRAETLDELAVAYVEGLRSGDRYFNDDIGHGVYVGALTGRPVALHARVGVDLACATGYLRCGYGAADQQLAHTLPLFLAARDLRAIDNAGTEFGEIARSAADFMVEARGCSDGYNVLAWPLIRAAGGVLLDLEGRDLARRPFRPGEPVDYVLAGNRALGEEIVRCMRELGGTSRAAVDAVRAGLATSRGDGAR